MPCRICHVHPNTQPSASMFCFSFCLCSCSVPVCIFALSTISCSSQNPNVYNYSSSVLCPAMLIETDANVPWRKANAAASSVNTRFLSAGEPLASIVNQWSLQTRESYRLPEATGVSKWESQNEINCRQMADWDFLAPRQNVAAQGWPVSH